MKTLFLLFLTLVSQAQPSNNNFILAKSVFASFQRCAKIEGRAQHIIRSECATQYLAKPLVELGAQYYDMFLYGKFPISNVAPCEKTNMEIIKRFEVEKFDLVLCFAASYYGDKKKSYVFFQMERESPKISKIKW